MWSYSQAMTKAPRNQALLLLVPTGLKDIPLALEIGWWDAKLKRWQGDWRIDQSETGATSNPIAWAMPPEIDAKILMGLPKPATKDKALTVALKASIKKL